MTDSPAFYEERIRLLQAEIEQLREALERIAEQPGFLGFIARTALDETPNKVTT